MVETITKTWSYSGTAGSTLCGGGGVFTEHLCNPYGSSFENLLLARGVTYDIEVSLDATFQLPDLYGGGCMYCGAGCGRGGSGSQLRTDTCVVNAVLCSNTGGGKVYNSKTYTPIYDTWLNPKIHYNIPWSQGRCCICECTGTIFVSTDINVYTISGSCGCVGRTELFVREGEKYSYVDGTSEQTYSFRIFDKYAYCLIFDGSVHYFTCKGSDIVYNYNMCGDPCEGVVCGNVCHGYNLWSQECIEGVCMDVAPVEINSTECGYVPPDLCEGITCDNICIENDLWSQKCLDGICIEDVLLEANAAICKGEDDGTPVDFIIDNKEYALLLILAGLAAGVVLE